MDKHKQVDGFTLIEMLIVLFLVSLLLLLFPLFSTKQNSIVIMQVETLKYAFIQAQSEAIEEKVRVEIECDGNVCWIHERKEELKNNMHCYGNVTFNESGNANRATTFTCSIFNQTSELIVQLGSGRMYVR